MTFENTFAIWLPMVSRITVTRIDDQDEDAAAKIADRDDATAVPRAAL